MSLHNTRLKEGFAAAYRSVLEAPDLNDGELRTLLYLILLGQRKVAFAQQSTIAKGTNKSRRTIIRHYKSLEQKGYISINHRLGSSSEVRFTSKSLPMTLESEGGDSNVTQLDKLSMISLGMFNDKIPYCVDFFEKAMGISAGDERENWERCFADILQRVIVISDIFDAIDYVANNPYWRDRVHSPLFFLRKDRNGTEYIIRFIRESRTLQSKSI